MTWDELCTAIASGEMPKVTYNGKIGKVVVIKNNTKGYKGCAVIFDKPYDEWFWESEQKDKRSKYMRDLTII